MFKVSLLATNTIKNNYGTQNNFLDCQKNFCLLGIIWNCKDVDALWDAGKISKSNALIQGFG